MNSTQRASAEQASRITTGFAKGQRVELHPATSEWMQGDRYGVVIGYGRKREYIDHFHREAPHTFVRPVRVKLDKSRRVRTFHPANLTDCS